MNQEGAATTESNAAAAARVASIIEHSSQPAFALLLQLADRYFADPGFEDALAQGLRDCKALIARWEAWSADQRWTPGAYMEGTEVGWFDGARSNVRIHPERAAAVADFIRRLAAWPSTREVLEVGRSHTEPAHSRPIPGSPY